LVWLGYSITVVVPHCLSGFQDKEEEGMEYIYYVFLDKIKATKEGEGREENGVSEW
jgi:hypothetical protein